MCLITRVSWDWGGGQHTEYKRILRQPPTDCVGGCRGLVVGNALSREVGFVHCIL